MTKLLQYICTSNEVEYLDKERSSKILQKSYIVISTGLCNPVSNILDKISFYEHFKFSQYFLYFNFPHFFKFRSVMCSMFFPLLLTAFLVLVRCQYMIDMTKVVEDRALNGYHYRTHSDKTVDECFLNCYEDCFCMAFQICKSTQCQLLSSNQFQSPSALVFVEGCSYYDMLPDLQQVNHG